MVRITNYPHPSGFAVEFQMACFVLSASAILSSSR